jgi:hypothetical protein
MNESVAVMSDAGEQGEHCDRHRRRAIIAISSEMMLYRLMAMTNDYPQWISLPKFEGIPKDIEVRGVQYSIDREAFLFSVTHPSFEVVPDGMPSPVLNDCIQMVSVRCKIGEETYE